NMYMPLPYPLQQNPAFQQPYYYGQTPLPAIILINNHLLIRYHQQKYCLTMALVQQLIR
ncbi:unnamed protein product, partial [Rotaria socialis]